MINPLNLKFKKSFFIEYIGFIERISVVLIIIAVVMGILGVLLFIIANPLEKIMALDKIGKEDEEELEVQQA